LSLFSTAGIAWPSPIPRLFYERTKKNSRVLEYRSAVLTIESQIVPLSVFLDLLITVKNVEYPSLGEILQKAASLLSPAMIESPLVFGLGDAHRGNLLIGNIALPNARGDFLHN
jgi:hypothetical protein